MNEPETDESENQSSIPLCFGHNTEYEYDAEACDKNCKLIKQCMVATLLKHNYEDVTWYTHLN